MMLCLRIVFLAFLFFPCMAGCAIYPDVQDVTGYSPYDIEGRIRCETQKALQDKVIEVLARQDDINLKSIAHSLDVNRIKFVTFINKPIPEFADYIRRYRDAAVAYDFTFDITEDNEADSQVNFLAGITGGAVKLGIKSSNDRSREGISRFQASDTFGKLIVADIGCGAEVKTENFQYPIAGTVGIKGPLDQFLNLNEFGNLTKVADKPAEQVPTYTATFNFQTVVSGSASPSVTLSPVRHGFSDAMLNSSVKRTDIHKLILGFSIKPIDPRAARVSGFNLLGLNNTALTGNKTSAETQATSAVNDSRLKDFLDRSRVVNIQ